jgi:hypothetical protein
MANDFTGRVWKINTAGQSPFGTANVKIETIQWTGMSAGGQTFTITDADGRVYTLTSYAADYPITFSPKNWFSGPLTFGGTFTGEIDLYIPAK